MITIAKPIENIDTLWTPSDPLGEALHFLRMNSIFCSRSELSGSWSIALPAMQDCLMFHVVSSGQCWFEAEGVENRLLKPGDFALVPHGKGHILSSQPGMPTTDLFDLPREQISERYEIIRHSNGNDMPTKLICGAVRFSHPAARHLVELLPKIICIESWDSPQMSWIQSTLRLMAAEASELLPGGETVITRLADILVIQAIRSWMEKDPAAQTGWLGALQDKQIGQSILHIHRNPEYKWTVKSLAAKVAMSRSAYAARFKEIVGESPMQYVARWRMNVAQMWIREENLSFTEIASRLGYDSEAAFNRAFKRIIGITPGAARRTGDEMHGIQL
jgi:AraC-like DNA-binding protein